MVQWGGNGDPVKLVRLRVLCSQNGFILERAAVKGTWRLIHEGIGHAVYNEAGRRNAFSLSEALRYMREIAA